MANNNDIGVIVKRRTHHMRGMGDITDDELPPITELTVLNGRYREGEPNLEHKPLSSRIGSCENLITLSLLGCSSIPPDMLGCTKLSKLHLQSHSGNDDNDCRIELPEGVNFPNLNYVNIRGSGNWNTNEIMSWLVVSCPNLHGLYFYNLTKDTANHFMGSLQNNEAFVGQIRHTLHHISFDNCNLNEDDLRSFLFDIKPLYRRLSTINLRNNNIESIESIGMGMREIPPANNNPLQSNLKQLWFNGNAFLGHLNDPNSSDHTAMVCWLKNQPSLSKIDLNNETSTYTSVIDYWLMINGSGLRPLLDEGYYDGTQLRILPYLMHHNYNQRRQDPTTYFTFLCMEPIFRTNYYNTNDDDNNDDDDDNVDVDVDVVDSDNDNDNDNDYDNGGGSDNDGSGTKKTLQQFLQDFKDATATATTAAYATATATATVVESILGAAGGRLVPTQPPTTAITRSHSVGNAEELALGLFTAYMNCCYCILVAMSRALSTVSSAVTASLDDNDDDDVDVDVDGNNAGESHGGITDFI